MIVDTILRWIWVAIAFCIAAAVALMALFVLGSFWIGGELRAAAPDDPLLWWGAEVFGAVFFTAAVAPALTALPGLVAVVAGELMRLRSGLYYTLAGGAALAAIPLLAGAPEDGATLPAPQYMTLFAAAGFLGGFLYWLMAGRRA